MFKDFAINSADKISKSMLDHKSDINQMSKAIIVSSIIISAALMSGSIQYIVSADLDEQYRTDMKELIENRDIDSSCKVHLLRTLEESQRAKRTSNSILKPLLIMGFIGSSTIILHQVIKMFGNSTN